MELNKGFEEYHDSEMSYNKIDYSSFNTTAFNKKYDIIKLVYRGKKNYIDFKSTIFEDLVKVERILSVSFIGGNAVYLLINKNNSLDWFTFFEDEKYADFIKEDFHIKEENKKKEQWRLDVAYNLLLNALARTSENSSNLNGNLYIYFGEEKKQVITINLCIKSGILEINQQSFIELAALTDPSKKAEVKKYILKAGTNGSRVLFKNYDFSENEKVYVKGSFGRVMSIYDHRYVNEKHKNSRMDVVHTLVEDFDYEYSDIGKLEFITIPVKTKSVKKHYNVKNDTEVVDQKQKDFKSLEEISLIVASDVVADDDKIKNLIEVLEENEIKVSKKKDFVKGEVAISIIHEKDYYKNEADDIKSELPKDAIIQNITIENIEKSTKKDLKNIVIKTLSELIIKRELYNKKLEEWNFGKCEFYLGIRQKNELGEDSKHFLMKVDKDGSFEIIEDEDKIGLKYTKHINSNGHKKNNGNYKDVNVYIVSKDNKMVEIKHTDYIPIMDRESTLIANKESKKTRSVKKDFRLNKKLYPYIGKSVMCIADVAHYTVGGDDSPQSNISTINNIYSMNILTDSEDGYSEFIAEILEMLRNYHIRSNRTESVRPYAFKHLIEYVRLNNPCKNIYLK